MPSVAAGAWDPWRPATCLPDDCFCETIGDGLVRQPANTWSSLAFVLVALWAGWRLLRPAGKGGRSLPGPEAALFVSSLLVVGLGSAFYHASLTFVGQVLDVSGMYLVATFMLLHRLGPRWRLPPVAAILAFVTVNGALMVGQVTTPAARRVAFALMLAAAILVEWRSSGRGRFWLGVGAGLMTVAFGIWALDRWRILCDPGSALQGHAVWHILGALAAAALFRSYEAEAGADR